MANANNLIPVMSANSVPSGICSADSELSAAWYAFNHNLSDFWHSGPATDFIHYLQYQFDAAVIIKQYSITGARDAPYIPVNWTLLGSNTGAFAGEETTLDTQTNQFPNGIVSTRIYDFVNTVAYLYYRLAITGPTGAGYNTTYCVIAEFQLNSGEYSCVYPITIDNDTVKATTYYGAGWEPYKSVSPNSCLAGGWDNWISAEKTTNQRFHIDLGTTKKIERIYYQNGHYGGIADDISVQNFTFWGSNSADDFNDLTYANDGTWNQLTTETSVMIKHIAANFEDQQYILVTNNTAYRYYAFKFADNWGNTGIMGTRLTTLQVSNIIHAPTTNIKKFCGVEYSKIKKISNKEIALIKKINRIT